jgi:hypothetical protein
MSHAAADAAGVAAFGHQLSQEIKQSAIFCASQRGKKIRLLGQQQLPQRAHFGPVIEMLLIKHRLTLSDLVVR